MNSGYQIRAYLLSVLSASIIYGCGVIGVGPAGSNVPPEVFYAAPMAEPPYYANSNFYTGSVGYFDIVLDSDEQRESQRISASKEQDWHLYTVQKYLKDSLPEFNEYFRQSLDGIDFLSRLPQNDQYRIDWRDYYSNADRNIYLLDLPRVHFGDPARIIENPNRFTFPYDNKKYNWLAVTQGTNMWFERFHDMYSKNLELDYYLDIRVGLVEVTPHHTVVKRSPFSYRVSEHRIGTDLTLNNEGRASSELPINVIAFKGLLYNRAGEVVNAGVEGFIPLYPNTGNFRQDLKKSLTLDHTLNSMIQSDESMHLITSTEDLDEINEYPWKQALDNLVRQLVYGGQ